MTSAEQIAERQWRQSARALIQEASTLTLATAGDDGPWSAPVYYVWLGERFYFFSSPRSRHIRDALSSGSAAASVYHQGESWRELRGIQMSGSIESVDSMAVSMQVVGAYLKRFAFVRSFFDRRPPTLQDFIVRFEVQLYGFTPTVIYYGDNRFGFGNRRRLLGPLSAK